MNLNEVMTELKSQENPKTKEILLRHGAQESFYGVKIEFLKKLQRRIKVDHTLALSLYATGNTDAMYLAGLVADPAQMTRTQLNIWVKSAYWYMLSCFTVPWVTSESAHGRHLAMKWMISPHEQITAAGWCTYASLLSITPDDKLDFDEIRSLLERVQQGIHQEQNRAKYAMNSFVISAGCYVPELTELAKATAKAYGKVKVDMGDTSCKVPNALEAIEKVEALGRLGKKRGTAFC